MADICIVSPQLYWYFDPQSGWPSGGAERQQSMISRRLVARGHDVSAIVADYGQDDAVVHDGITFVKEVPDVAEGPIAKINATYNLGKAMASRGADIYVVYGAPLLSTATYLLSKMGGKFIFHLMNDTDVDLSYLRSRYTSLFLPLYRTMLRSSYVLSQTEHQKRMLKKGFEVQSKLVPTGYHLPDPSEVLPAERRNHVLWVGSSAPDRKNPRRFLQLAGELPDLDFTMISQPIPGKESFHQALEEEAREVTNLDFLGPVAPNEVHEHYRTALMLVNTSSNEGFPNTFLEAWRYETPIASLHFDLDGLLSDENGGIRAGTMENLVSSVRRLATDGARRAALGADGRSYMKNNYSLSRVVDLYEEAFQDVLG
ncbi:glycosyltransferase family 4 protein [Salinibacter sp.]|uniref:glycosyltransferase family 4 protein n=1 Tax=Salinibacter sp. TaxID=2065818 RepID=UPI0021E72954|nr:glycosyltransferase family 4 protein [Salinibacter sp.]